MIDTRTRHSLDGRESKSLHTSPKIRTESKAVFLER